MYLPLRDRVLCREIKTEETKPGSKIILVEDTRDNLTQQQAEVVAVGPENDEPRLVEGAWIVHRPFARVHVEDGLFYLKAEDVVAILEEG